MYSNNYILFTIIVKCLENSQQELIFIPTCVYNNVYIFFAFYFCFYLIVYSNSKTTRNVPNPLETLHLHMCLKPYSQ